MHIHIFLVILFAIFMLPSLGAAFIPFFPAIPYVFVLALIFEVFDRFQTLTFPELGILFIFPVAAFLVDQFAGVIGSKYGGAKASAWYAVFGTFVGTIFLPPFGGIIGLFFGIILGELTKDRTDAQAIEAAKAGVIGSFTGMLVKCLLAAAFIILFLFFTLR